MKRLIAVVSILSVAGVVAACTDSKRARQAATWGDQPADVTCWTYGTENFRGRSTGKVEYDEGGRVSFVDAANGRYTTIEGDCRVVYLTEGEDGEPASVAPAQRVPTPQPAQQGSNPG